MSIGLKCVSDMKYIDGFCCFYTFNYLYLLIGAVSPFIFDLMTLFLCLNFLLIFCVSIKGFGLCLHEVYRQHLGESES